MSNANGNAHEAKQESLRFLERLFENIDRRGVRIRFWDGSVWPDPDGGEAPATVVLKHPGSLRSMFASGSEVRIGEAFIYDDFDIEGDVQAVLGIADDLARNRPNLLALADMARTLHKLPRKRRRTSPVRQPAALSGRQHSVERDRQAVQYHYDLSNDFFKLWLDRRMVYSCAYYGAPGDSLDTAQERKLDYICRKLRLKPGERLLDIGCGWGGLVIWAAEHYGVKALGITLSENQARYASEQIRAAGLQKLCRVEPRDYREVDEPGAFDKLVSVGMFEHVGEELMPVYFRLPYRLLKPGGVFLNHGIAASPHHRRQGHDSFIDRYVFPDGELIPINTSLHAAEEEGFEVRDVESLREHYTLTLEEWVRRLEDKHAAAVEIADEEHYRTMRIYMSASAYGFRKGSISVFQTLLAKPHENGDTGLPLTRENWYAGAHTGGPG